MFRNYLKIAFRNLFKYRFYSLINISGLTLGMICFLFIFLYVKDEWSFDRHFKDADRIYRLNFYAKLGGQVVNSSTSPKPAGPTFKEEIPEIEAFCRLRTFGNYVVHYDNQAFKEEKVVFADSTLFQVFSFKMLAGDPATALREPNSVVITKRIAEKYFGHADPIGKTLKFGEEASKITGVMEDIPANTHFQFDFFRSLGGLNLTWDTEWGSTNYHNYYLLREGADPKALSEKAEEIFVSNFRPVLKQYLNTTWEDFLKAGNYVNIEFFPIQKIHLYSDLDEELGANGDVKYVYIFSIIGLFILTLACINFMNLATARSAVRAREIGVRKAVGALRSDLTRQFLSESTLMAFLAMLLAVGGLQLLLPYFNEVSGKALTLHSLLSPALLATAVALAGVIGLAAGSYPAFYLSAFQPVKVLKGGMASLRKGEKGAGFRNGLVVFQFFTTTVLIIGSLVVYQQLRFIQEKKLGYDKENVLVLQDAHLLGDQLNSFKERMLKNPAVHSVTACDYLPATTESNTSTLIKGRKINPENTILVNHWWVDEDYVPTMGLKIVDGRDFSKEITTDTAAAVINETLAHSFGYPQQSVLGQEIGFPVDNGKVNARKIIGVVEDFNFSSLRNNIEPLVLFYGGYHGYLALRFETKDVEGLIKNTGRTWSEMAPGQPFAYTFLDERFNRLYDTETRISKIIGAFAFLAILIACMGLLGLATFTIQQRTKEIGVRKVLGASAAGIVGLLSKDFLKLVIIAIVFAGPLAWYLMHRWLEHFAYRVNIQWWVFLLAGVLAVVLAFLTISFQSIKAALSNPVKSLRSE